MAKLKIKLKKSMIGLKKKQKETVKALGLSKIGQTTEKNDDAAIRGMISKISHVVEVSEV